MDIRLDHNFTIIKDCLTTDRRVFLATDNNKFFMSENSLDSHSGYQINKDLLLIKFMHIIKGNILDRILYIPIRSEDVNIIKDNLQKRKREITYTYSRIEEVSLFSKEFEEISEEDALEYLVGDL